MTFPRTFLPVAALSAAAACTAETDDGDIGVAVPLVNIAGVARLAGIGFTLLGHGFCAFFGKLAVPTTVKETD